MSVQWTMEAKPDSAGLELPIGLVSIDYSKTLRWRGSGTPREQAQRRLAEARRLATRLSVPLRVHQAPPIPAVYRWLLGEGVDWIGVKSDRDLDALRRAGPP
jgi:hypothetical protein